MALRMQPGGWVRGRLGRSKTKPGRLILTWLVAYAGVLVVLDLVGYEDSSPELWLPVGALAGYAIGYFTSRSPGTRGESAANFLFFAALAALTIIVVLFATMMDVAPPPAPDSTPWLGIIGFVLGVLAAAYVRLKHLSEW